MKPPLALAFALLCAALAVADDLALKDGRVLKDAVVLKQDAATITVRHTGGFTQVEKQFLPDDLAAKYPIDYEAAEREQERTLREISEREKQRAQAYAHQIEEAEKMEYARAEANKAVFLNSAATSVRPKERTITNTVCWETPDGVYHFATIKRRIGKDGKPIWGAKGVVRD